MEDLVSLEIETMKLNAFKVCHEVADRIDGAIAPDGYMKVYESLCYM